MSEPAFEAVDTTPLGTAPLQCPNLWVPESRGVGAAPGYKPGCSMWPGARGGRLTACPGSITLRSTNGTTSTLLQRQSVPRDMRPGWGLVAPSADGRWLLLEDESQSCGTHVSAFFLPAAGGHLIPAVPDVASSEALGWLNNGAGSALVAVQGEGCDGSPPSGIYAVQPYADATSTVVVNKELILQARADDATTWGGPGV